MRRIIVALALTSAFAIGMMTGLSSEEARAATVCKFMKCSPNEMGVWTRWICCRDTDTGQVDCAETTSGCVQFPTFY